MPLVSKPSAFACRAERLARAGSGPERAIVGNACEAQGVAPHADAGEEVALGVSHKVIWDDILDASFIHVSRRDVALADELSEPCRAFASISL